MGLKPLEFSEALLDSPYFRENIHEHEKELDRTNDAIKLLIKECRSLIKATDQLSRAQRSFANVLSEFRLECIGEIDTDDEIEIARAFETFSQLFCLIDDERKRVVENAATQLIDPLEKFRRDQIGEAREEKRKFDKQTEKYCNSLQNFLSISTKKSTNSLEETLVQERDNFYETALSYVFKLQEVNEKKKYEFVETLLGFVYGQMTFFHSGHEAFEDHKQTLVELQVRLQNTRDRFDFTKEEAVTLQEKTRKKAQAGELQSSKMYARQGYLQVQKKGKGGLGTTWAKNFCMYTKENKIFTMVPYVQTQTKLTGSTDTVVLNSCVRRMTDSIDKRFCFDVTAQDRPQPITLQAFNDEDRKQWLCAMDGTEPIYLDSNDLAAATNNTEKKAPIASFDNFLVGQKFLKKCVAAIEKRGITDQGLYRIVGVGSKVQKLLEVCFEKRQIDEIELDSDESEFEVKTITSAVKHYLRSMTTPLLTFDLHDSVLEAAKTESYDSRVAALKSVVDKLPYENYEMLDIITEHLKNVAANSKQNLMQASNLGVVFGPTLMRSKEETMAAIMNLKYQTIVVEMMINEYDTIFDSSKPSSSIAEEKPKSSPTKKPELPDKRPIREKQQMDQKSGVYSCPPPLAPRAQTKVTALNKQKSHPAPLPPPSRIKSLSLQRKQHCSLSSEGENVTSPSESNVMSKLKAFESTDNKPKNNGAVTVSSQYATTGPTAAAAETRARQDGPPPLPTSPPPKDHYAAPPPRTIRKVRTKFPCVGENSTELTFDAGAIIVNVRDSKEPGWLEGTLNGKTGLIPSNYVEFI